MQLPLTPQFTLSNAKNVSIVIVNVSVNGVFNGTFKVYVNGEPETLKGNDTEISGFISNGTLVGNITTMSFSQVYISQLSGVQYLGGYVAGNIGEVGEMQLNSVIASASISSSKVSYLNALSELTPSMILPPTSSYNVSVDQLNGEAIVNGASGSVTTSSNTEVVFYQSPSILNPGLSVQVFDGTIDGNLYFEAPNEYIELGSGLSYDILSINPMNINNNNGYIILGPLSLGDVSIVTPIVLKLQFEVENPTNVTEVFTSMPVALKLYEYYSLFNAPNEQQFFYTNYLGVSDIILNPPLVVSPLQNVTKTITISIPVTGILTPNIQDIHNASVLNSGQIEYIEMNIGLTTSNGYTFTAEIIVTPYAVYTYPTSFS